MRPAGTRHPGGKSGAGRLRSPPGQVGIPLLHASLPFYRHELSGCVGLGIDDRCLVGQLPDCRPGRAGV